MLSDNKYVTDSRAQYEQDPQHAILSVDISNVLEEEEDSFHNPSIEEYKTSI